MPMMDECLVWDGKTRDWDRVALEDHPVTEPWWWHAGESVHWPPTDDLLDRLADAMRASARCGAVIGPSLRGPGNERPEGLHLPGWVLVSLVVAPNPEATLLHELHHEVWQRIGTADQEILAAHGRAVRRAYKGPASMGSWLDESSKRWGPEAAAWAFDQWTQRKDAAGVKPGEDVKAIWERIKSGAYYCDRVDGD